MCTSSNSFFVLWFWAGVFLANFPEAMSSSGTMKANGIPVPVKHEKKGKGKRKKKEGTKKGKKEGKKDGKKEGK